MIQGKPLEIPKQKMLRKRLSLYVFNAENKKAALGGSAKRILSHEPL